MTTRIQRGSLAIDQILFNFIETALPGTGLDSDTYWKNFEQVVLDLTPKNKALLAKRDDLQAAMALIRKDLSDHPLSFNNFRD